jgi:hypothetical protein
MFKYKFGCGCVVSSLKIRYRKFWAWLDPCKFHASIGVEPGCRRIIRHPTKLGATKSLETT